MTQDDIFSTEHDTIDLSGIDSIMQLARYKPSEPGIFLEGLELAEDLTTDSGSWRAGGISLQRSFRV